ncbi:MAG: TetR/AcrR family transcriptional regulator [Microthrixaceae bacterium]|nr:TetR family transcriptional regulator [Microthrixaceae bacterium]MCO5321203.1 TetR/AcrR family transcriptional regulator [Microthrixaceae bacterium]
MQTRVKLWPMNAELGLRERKKLERRAAIESAALDLFEEHGFDSTTTEQIAARADIAPRTFFLYFPTKEDVVLADYAQRLDRIVEELGSRPADESPWDALRASLLVVASDYEHERSALIRRFSIMTTNPSVFARSLALQAGWEDTLSAVIAERIGSGHDDGGITARLLASAALAAMRSAIQHWVISGHHEALPDLLTSCFDQLAHGLAEVR